MTQPLVNIGAGCIEREDLAVEASALSASARVDREVELGGNVKVVSAR